MGNPFVAFWQWVRSIFAELWDTLSNKPSKLSSIRLERMVFTVTVVAITWIINMYNLGKWTSTDHVITLSPLLIAGGYNIVQARKNREVDKPGNSSNEDGDQNNSTKDI